LLNKTLHLGADGARTWGPCVVLEEAAGTMDCLSSIPSSIGGSKRVGTI
jgi:hypothetical protein